MGLGLGPLRQAPLRPVGPTMPPVPKSGRRLLLIPVFPRGGGWPVVQVKRRKFGAGPPISEATSERDGCKKTTIYFPKCRGQLEVLWTCTDRWSSALSIDCLWTFILSRRRGFLAHEVCADRGRHVGTINRNHSSPFHLILELWTVMLI